MSALTGILFTEERIYAQSARGDRDNDGNDDEYEQQSVAPPLARIRGGAQKESFFEVFQPVYPKWNFVSSSKPRRLIQLVTS